MAPPGALILTPRAPSALNKKPLVCLQWLKLDKHGHLQQGHWSNTIPWTICSHLNQWGKYPAQLFPH